MKQNYFLRIFFITLCILQIQGCNATFQQAVTNTKKELKGVVGYIANKQVGYHGRYIKDDFHLLRNELNLTLSNLGLEDFIISTANDAKSRYILVNNNGETIYTKTGNRVKITETSSKKYSDYINKAATKYEVDPALIFAVIKAESAFNTRAVSPVGAQGLMQLMPSTAKMLGVQDPFDPEQNIMGGTLYLRMLFKRFKTQELVLAAYNAGPGNVKKYGNQIPPFPETRKYVTKVCKFCDQYKLG